MAALDKGNLCMAPWCDESSCEIDVKKRSGGKEEQEKEETEEEAKAKAEKEAEEARSKLRQEIQKLQVITATVHFSVEFW